MAQYAMQEVNDLHNEGQTLLYPRMVIEGCFDTDEVIRRVARTTTFSSGDVKGVLEAVRLEMAYMMASGYSVRLDGIGTFTPSLALRKGKERETPDGESRRNAMSIKVGSINFRVDKEWVKEVDSNCHLTRKTGGYKRHVSKYTPEERLALAQRYLETHSELTVLGYAYLTGLSRTTAGRELRRWHETEGSGIGIKGFGSHRVYVRERK